MDAFSIAVSIGLQYGVPLETYVSKFTNLSFEPNGLTDDADVRMAKSLMDYVFRRLALDYLSFEDRQALGIYSAEERQRYLETGSYEPRRTTRSATPAKSSATSPPQTRTTSWKPRGRATVVEPHERRRDPGAPSVVEPAQRSEPSRDPKRRPPDPRGPHLRRAHGKAHRHRRRLPALHDLRHQDAPRRLLLRLRRLRQHQRLQLTELGEERDACGGRLAPLQDVECLRSLTRATQELERRPSLRVLGITEQRRTRP